MLDSQAKSVMSHFLFFFSEFKIPWTVSKLNGVTEIYIENIII